MDAYSFFAQNFLLPLLAGVVLLIIGTLRGWTWKKRVVLCLITFMVALGISFSVTLGGREKHQLSGVITDGRSRKPIPQVHVSVDGGLAVHDDITDTKGYFRLELADNVRDGDIVRLKVAKSGYVTYDESVAVPSGPLPVQITLEQNDLASEPVEWISVPDNYGYEKDGSTWTGYLVKASRDVATPMKLELTFTGPVLGDPTIKIIEGVSLPVSSSFLRRNDNTFTATIANPPLRVGDFLWVKATSRGAVAVSVTCLECPSK